MKTADIYLYNPNNTKNPEFNMWMAFPGPEAFALSSLGFLWMYKSIDELENVNIEAVYSDSAEIISNISELSLI